MKEWMDPTCRKVLTESLGEEKVAAIDAQYQRSMHGQQIMLDVIKAFVVDKQAGGDVLAKELFGEWARKDAAKRTNEMSIKAYNEACSLGPVACGPVLIEEE